MSNAINAKQFSFVLQAVKDGRDFTFLRTNNIQISNAYINKLFSFVLQAVKDGRGFTYLRTNNI
jgi:hypothetical protein